MTPVSATLAKSSRVVGFVVLVFWGSVVHALELKLASTPWPPFTGAPGEPRVVIELVDEVLRRAKITSTVSIVKEGTLTRQLKDRQFDGSPALWRDKDREIYLIYSAPLLENRLVLVGRKGSDVSARSLEALAGKRIGVVEGYAYGESVKQATKTFFVMGANHQENLQKLLQSELDYMLVEDLLVQHALAHQGSEMEAHLQIGRVALVKRTLHFALRKDVPNAATVIQDFDAKLAGVLADGTYNRVLELNWIRADVDGDGRFELIPRSNRVGQAPPSKAYSIVDPGPDESANTPRYLIDGRVYSDWSKMPTAYQADPIPPPDPSMPFMQLKF